MKTSTLLRTLLCFVLLFSTLLLTVSCGKDLDPYDRVNEIETYLKDKGFNVIRYGKGAPNPTLELSIDSRVVCEISATRGMEFFTVKLFKATEDASFYGKAWQESYELSPNMVAVYDEYTVFYGSRSVYELIKEKYTVPEIGGGSK